MNIGEKIRIIRNKMNITQHQLAGEEFTKGYISQIERGNVLPSTKALKVISDRLGKPISYFLDDTDNYKVNQEKMEKKFILGENLFLQKKYGKALETFDEVIDNDLGFSNTIHIYSKLYKGKCLYYTDKYNESLNILLDTVQLIEELGIYNKLIDTYLFVGLGYFNLKDYEKAIINFKRGLVVIEENEIMYKRQKALLVLNIATSYMNMGSLAMALNYFDNNIIYCKSSKVIDTLLDCYVREGYIYFKLGKYRESKSLISKAISLNNSLDYDIIKAEILNILAVVIAKEGKVKQSIKLLKKSIEICNRIKYTSGFYSNIIEWINILVENNEIEEAEEKINDHIYSLKNTKYKFFEYMMYGQLGHIYIIKKNFVEGKNKLIIAIEGLLSENKKLDAANFSKILAEELVNLEPEAAKKYYNLSIRCLEEINNLIT